jgi:saccharopine dehydrogenase-like NADP-dependent oxidoreductase
VYLYHVADNAQTMAEYGCQAVVWQTAVGPAVALELINSGAWRGVGVLGPEAFPAAPFLDLLADLGTPPGLDERTPGTATHR